MKRLTALLAGLLLSLTALAAGPQYALEVKGLACPFCAYGIEKRLNKMEGVEEVEIDVGGSRLWQLAKGPTSPSAVTVDADGTVYTANFADNRVEQWRPAGTR